MKKWLTKQYSQSGSHFFFQVYTKRTRKSIEKCPSRWRDCVLIFFFHRCSIMTISCFWSKKKNCEGSQSFSYSVETVGGGEEHGQLGIGESRKSSWQRGCLGLGMAQNSLGEPPRTWCRFSAAPHTLSRLESWSHSFLLESFWESLCCRACILSLGEGSGMQQWFPRCCCRENESFCSGHTASVTPLNWGEGWGAVGNACGLQKQFWKHLQSSIARNDCFTQRCDGLGVKSGPRQEYSETTERDPQGHMEWPFQGWPCDESRLHTSPVCWVPTIRFRASGPHRQLQTSFTEMRTSCIWQVHWKNIASNWTKDIQSL